MSSTWRRASAEVLEVRSDPQLVLRLFGLPFLAIGLWLGSHVAGAFWHVVSRQVPLADNLLAFTLLPAVAALFLWPGVLLVLTRKRWVIDAAAGEALETTDIWIARWSRRHPLTGFRSVRAYQGRESSRDIHDRSRRAPQPYCVDLVAAERGVGTRTVAAMSGPAEAVELARALAALAKLPLVDDTEKDDESCEEEGPAAGSRG